MEAIDTSSSKKPSSLKERSACTSIIIISCCSTQYSSHRLAAMGATPALGNGMPLPKTSGQQRSNLHVNASLASREMFLSKHGVELSTPGATPGPSPCAPWMVRMQKVVAGMVVHRQDHYVLISQCLALIYNLSVQKVYCARCSSLTHFETAFHVCASPGGAQVEAGVIGGAHPSVCQQGPHQRAGCCAGRQVTPGGEQRLRGGGA